MQIEEITEKFCRMCQTTKPSVEFSAVRRVYKGKTGESVYNCLQTNCKPCMALRAKQHVQSGYKRPQRTRKYKVSDVNAMGRPLSWFDMKGTSNTLETPKEYPTCEQGHKYVGTNCLLCKYGIIKQLSLA